MRRRRKAKKSLALKAVPHESESDEDEENEDKDEEVAMITRRIQRFLKKNRTPPRKSFKKFSKKDSGKNDTLICYKCNKPGHIKPDCPLLKKDQNKGKKAMKATWMMIQVVQIVKQAMKNQQIFVLWLKMTLR
ncbi:hypothetical protein I3760_14G043100 [Carya illinoinensis]|nr:hypothetical protein I3760_14G043100 [Carya illinoinensis]